MLTECPNVREGTGCRRAAFSGGDADLAATGIRSPCSNSGCPTYEVPLLRERGKRVLSHHGREPRCLAAYAGPIASLVHPLRKLFSAQRPLLPSSTACASEAGSLSAGCRAGSHGGEWGGGQALSGLRPEPVRPTPWASPQGRGTAHWSGDRPAGPETAPLALCPRQCLAFPRLPPVERHRATEDGDNPQSPAPGRRRNVDRSHRPGSSLAARGAVRGMAARPASRLGSFIHAAPADPATRTRPRSV